MSTHMVNNFTPNRKRRSEDVYSPAGIPKRPDRATIVYTNKVHELFPGTPIIIGGIEASLRRFAHYDYWQDRVRQSILADAPADLLVFGMGERQVIEIANRLASGEHISSIQDIRGTAFTLDYAHWRNLTTGQGSSNFPVTLKLRRTKQHTPVLLRCIITNRIPSGAGQSRNLTRKLLSSRIRRRCPCRPGSSTIYMICHSPAGHIHHIHTSSLRLKQFSFPLQVTADVLGVARSVPLRITKGRIIQSRSSESIIREVARYDEDARVQGYCPGYRGSDGKHVPPFMRSLGKIRSMSGQTLQPFM